MGTLKAQYEHGQQQLKQSEPTTHTHTN